MSGEKRAVPNFFPGFARKNEETGEVLTFRVVQSLLVALARHIFEIFRDTMSETEDR